MDVGITYGAGHQINWSGDAITGAQLPVGRMGVYGMGRNWMSLADGKQFMLAQVRWLMGADNGDVHAGVKLLPGLPRPLAVRPTGLNVQADSWAPAIALSAVPALESPPSLVLPSGWYKPKRVVELHDQQSSKAMLTEVIERGIDFERVAYQTVP